MVRGIRGAVAVDQNTAEVIVAATGKLLEQIVMENRVDLKEIAAVHFSATPDLDQAFPAHAARLMGWRDVPLFCHVEMNVPGAMPRCIRVLMLVNTEQEQDQIRHIYLGETRRLREL